MYYLNLNQDNSYYLRVNLFLKITVTIAAPQIAITKTFIAILAVSPVLGASVFVVFLSAVSTFLFVLSFVLLLSFSTAGFTGVVYGFTESESALRISESALDLELAPDLELALDLELVLDLQSESFLRS